MPETVPEPWLRGPLTDVHPLIQPVFFSFAQVREDLARHVKGLAREQIWQKLGAVSLGFQLKHIAGSVDRLTTYLVGKELNEEQMRALRGEQSGDEDTDQLIALVNRALSASEQRLRIVDPEQIYAPRTVGRKRLPTTVIGLLMHLSEHTQRHLGQAITTAKFLRDAG